MANPHGYHILKATRCYNIMDALAGLRVHTTPTIEWYQDQLPRFSQSIEVSTSSIMFYNITAYPCAIQQYSQVYPDKNWNFPKMHSHQHAPSDILAKGVTSNYNTKPSEQMHGDLKWIYSEHTNFRNFEGQVWYHYVELPKCWLNMYASLRLPKLITIALLPSPFDTSLMSLMTTSTWRRKSHLTLTLSPSTLVHKKNPQHFSQLRLQTARMSYSTASAYNLPNIWTQLSHMKGGQMENL